MIRNRNTNDLIFVVRAITSVRMIDTIYTKLVTKRDLLVIAFHWPFGVDRKMLPQMFKICPTEYSIANAIISSDVTRDILAIIETTHPVTEQTSHPIARSFILSLGQQLSCLLLDKKLGKMSLSDLFELFPISDDFAYINNLTIHVHISHIFFISVANWFIYFSNRNWHLNFWYTTSGSCRTYISDPEWIGTSASKNTLCSVWFFMTNRALYLIFGISLNGL
jgi:hypothetical protein